MVSFAQFLDNSGIHMQPAVLIGIIAGGLLFIIILIIAVVYVHRRSKRQIAAGAFDKSAFSVASFTHPRPPLPTYQSSPRSFLIDREAQQHDLVGREVRQQESNYMQLMRDIQRPASRAGQPLPNQTPRQPPHHAPPRMTNRDPTQVALPRSPLTAYPVATAPLPAPPPFATLPVDEAETTTAVQLKRGLSVRSLDSASEYSVASAARSDGQQERTYQPFNLGLATIPASPSTPLTPKWPSSPGSYVWPKRQRASQIRAELAPETYAKVRWRTDDESTEPAATIPVAHALPSAPAPTMRSVSSPTSPGPPLRITVPPPPPVALYRMSSDSAASASTAQLYYANASTTRSSSPTLPDVTPTRPPPQTPQRPF
ncbi:hypothetical protein FB451DRAFT_1386782 [Mycena latifolia]|nr:hypothetical protein FB451DRAFT_1386782 [Mycena latifolia]